MMYNAGPSNPMLQRMLGMQSPMGMNPNPNMPPPIPNPMMRPAMPPSQPMGIGNTLQPNMGISNPMGGMQPSQGIGMNAGPSPQMLQRLLMGMRGGQ